LPLARRFWLAAGARSSDPSALSALTSRVFPSTAFAGLFAPVADGEVAIEAGAVQVFAVSSVLRSGRSGTTAGGPRASPPSTRDRRPDPQDTGHLLSFRGALAWSVRLSSKQACKRYDDVAQIVTKHTWPHTFRALAYPSRNQAQHKRSDRRVQNDASVKLRIHRDQAVGPRKQDGSNDQAPTELRVGQSHGFPNARFNKDGYTPRNTSSSARPAMISRKAQPSTSSFLRAPRTKKTAGTARASTPPQIDGFNQPVRSRNVTPIEASEIPGTRATSKNGHAVESRLSCQPQCRCWKPSIRGIFLRGQVQDD
jgi:hypothetical protein